MQVERPTFRPDLIAKPITVGKVRLFELCDPGTGRALRFTEDGYSIAYLLNGKRTLAQVREEFFAQRGVRISEDKLRRLLEQLELLGCLASDPNLTVPYNALATVALPVLGDGGMDEALATVVLGAEAFKDYYSIIPDVPVNADATRPGKKRVKHKPKSKVASISMPMPTSEALAKRKRRSAPPPIPFVAPKSKPVKSPPELEPSLPPLPGWPPLENAIRRSKAAQPALRRALPAEFEVAQAARVAEANQAAEVARRYPRARAHGITRKSRYPGGQALWLAGGFFAAALVWASWALTRAIL